ncbi:MAG: hypothetical protein NTY77_13015 [Elusimicrobia bacterium]|nr:hypothetical protein [Elusimicrobiota bacterium]
MTWQKGVLFLWCALFAACLVAHEGVPVQAESNQDTEREYGAFSYPGPFDHMEALGGLKSAGSPVDLFGVSVDLRPAKFSLEVEDYRSVDKPVVGKLYRSYAEAWKAMGPVWPWAMIPANAVDAYVREVADSTLASVSLAIEADDKLSTQKLLSGLRRALIEKKDKLDVATYETAVGFLDQALSIGSGNKSSTDRRWLSFFQDPVRSTPIGIWASNSQLENIFLRDHFLQTEFSFDKDGIVFNAFRNALKDNPDLLAAYKFQVSLRQKLENPFIAACLLGSKGRNKRWAFLPASRSPGITMRLTDNGKSPKEKVIWELGAAPLSLRPRSDSGYSDYEKYAFAALLFPSNSPEARKVEFEAGHAKDAKPADVVPYEKQEVGLPFARPSAPAPISIRPLFAIEPLPTAYARYASAINFLLKSMERLATVREIQLHEPLKRMIRSICDASAEFSRNFVRVRYS